MKILIKERTFPGIKQHRSCSTYLMKVMDNIEIRVSIDVKISQCRDNG